MGGWGGVATVGIYHTTHASFLREPGGRIHFVLQDEVYTVRTMCSVTLGYVHTVTFSHRFLLFGSKLEFPWDCGTIQSHAKTLPCARSLNETFGKHKRERTIQPGTPMVLTIINETNGNY